MGSAQRRVALAACTQTHGRQPGMGTENGSWVDGEGRAGTVWAAAAAGEGGEGNAGGQDREGRPLQPRQLLAQQQRRKHGGGQDLEGLAADLEGHRIQVAGRHYHQHLRWPKAPNTSRHQPAACRGKTHLLEDGVSVLSLGRAASQVGARLLHDKQGGRQGHGQAVAQDIGGLCRKLGRPRCATVAFDGPAGPYLSG